MKISAIKAARDKAVYLSDAINEHVAGAVTINDMDDPNGAFDNVLLGNVSQLNTSYRSDANDNQGDIGFKKLKMRFQVSVVFALQ